MPSCRGSPGQFLAEEVAGPLGLDLWIGLPVGWVWVASRTVKSSQPTLGPYLLRRLDGLRVAWR